MKKLLFLMLISLKSSAQVYVSLVPSIVNSPGTFSDKSNVSFELGKQWDVFSIGLDIGRTNLGKWPKSEGKYYNFRDTSIYLECRPNLNVFQQGKFTNTITPGIGYIFNAHETLVTEVTSGVEYSYSTTLHINIYFGQYYYSGMESSQNVSFFGISIMKYLQPYNNQNSVIPSK